MVVDVVVVGSHGLIQFGYSSHKLQTQCINVMKLTQYNIIESENTLGCKIVSHIIQLCNLHIL